VGHDARDALRRYLEQRRELGESELVLDSMGVDDVLAVLGARGGPTRPTGTTEELGAPADHPRLRDAEASPTPAPARQIPADAPDAARAADAVDVGDWRATLRAAGAAQDAPAAPPAAPSPAQPPSAPAAPPDRPQPDLEAIGAPLGLVVGGGESELFGGPTEQFQSLDEIAAAVAKCTRCPLYRTAKNPVPGQGNPNAEFVVVGEAPGGEEDASGLAFVGAAGQLLTKILAAISLAREDVFICNVMKHRPPGNRNPEPDEVEACSPYLVGQLELLRPKVILTLGNFAVQTLLGTKLGISKLRGQVHRYHGIPLVATYHPAALLRNPTWKRPTWEDVQLARRILDRAK
jgi:uracil-DNA glycosylase